MKNTRLLNQLIKSCLYLSLITLLGATSVITLAAIDINSSKGAARDIQIIEINPFSLPQIKGKAYANYSVQAVNAKGKLVPIPFQFDERNTLGLHHVKGGGLATIGKENIFDAMDELVFMFRDAGIQATSRQKTASGEVVSEIVLNDEGQLSYVYVLKGNAERSNRDYANYDASKHLFISDRWSMQTDPDNILIWTDHFMDSFEGGKKTFIDVMKVRVIAKVGFVKITLNNTNVVGKVTAVKNGPVRDILHLRTSIVVLNIPFITLDAGMEFSSGSLDLPVSAAVPIVAKAIDAPILRASLDFTNLPGALVRTGTGPKEPSLADRKMSEVEKKLSINKEEPWLAVTSKKGYDGVLMIRSNEESLKKGLSLSGYVNDTDEENEPERFPGSGPELGFNITNFSPGDKASFIITLFHTEKMWYDNTPEDFVHALLSPPTVSVN